jgi:glycosyltransferase involved in cell wall biosynthesis
MIGGYQKSDVDVVVLSYNHVLFIERCINSIASQETDYAINILVADDCSTDGTGELVKSLMEKYKNLYLIQQERNVGSIENARNVISQCQSPYLAFCEGDDFWIDAIKIQIQLDFLKANPDYGMVHGDVVYFDNKKGQVSDSVNHSKGVSFPSGYIFNEYLVSNKLFIFTASVVVKRELFVFCSDYSLFKEKNWLAQDLPTWLAIAQQTKIGYLDKVLSAYRLSDESASRSKSPAYTHAFHQSIFDVRFYFWNKYSQDKKVKVELDYLYSISLLADLRLLMSKKIWRELLMLKRKGNFSWELKRWMQFLYLSVQLLIKGR